MSNTNGKFQGQYIQDTKLALIASGVSGVHCMLIGPPGFGKTTIAEIMAEAMFEPQRKVFLEFEPTTPPEIVEGHYDIAALLGNPPVSRRIVDGTVNDPNAKVVICDELFRSMDPAFDPILHAMNRFKKMGDLSPVVWATSNFTATTERTEALRDRFGLWVWMQDIMLDWRSVAMNQMNGFGQLLDIGDGLPDWNDIQDIRAARPGAKAIRAVVDVIESLAQEAIKGFVDDKGHLVAKFDMNPRRTDQWMNVLFRMGYWISGNADFSEVPADARRCLQWAYPLTDIKMARMWAQVCNAVSDPVQTAIEGLKYKAYQAYKDVLSEDISKQAAATKLGKLLSENMRELRVLQDEMRLGEDDRITRAIGEIQEAFAKAVKGEDPMS